MTSLPSNGGVDGGLEPHECIILEDGPYRKKLFFPGGPAAADEWQEEYDTTKEHMKDIGSLELTKRFTADQICLWQIWLFGECRCMMDKWGLAGIPANMRWWIGVVLKELGRDAIDFGEDRGGNGKFDPGRVWRKFFYPPENLQQDGPITVNPDSGAFLVPFTFEGSYEKKIEFISSSTLGPEVPPYIGAPPNVRRQCEEWYSSMVRMTDQFQRISDMDGIRSGTDAQMRLWAIWLSRDVAPFVQLWGKHNVPGTMRARINAVECNLHAHEIAALAGVTDFGEDTNASGTLPEECNMPNF